MSIFTNEVLYAMNAIDLLCEFNQPSPCAYIAGIIGAPEPFLQRIMMNLAKAEIVSVKRGPGGGFSISIDQLRRFKVLDVLTALGQNVEEVKGHRASDRINNAVYDALNVTLEEFLA